MFINNSKALISLTFETKYHISTLFPQKRSLSVLNVFRPKPIVLNEKMTLRHCPGEPRTDRPLAIVMSWMLAKDKHVERYCQMYFRRGFDVLTCYTSPYDLLVPPRGVKVNARNLIKYMETAMVTYPDIIVHAFSVGAYLWAEILVELYSNEQFHRQIKDFNTSIKGAIFDSIVHVDECAPGLSRAITHNRILQPIIEASIKTYLANSFSTKYYRAAEPYFHGHYLKCPRMILSSEADTVSSPERNQMARDDWTRHGMRVQWKCWDDSAHVLHYHTHPREYEEEIDKFLGRSKIRWEPIRRFDETPLSPAVTLHLNKVVESVILNKTYNKQIQQF